MANSSLDNAPAPVSAILLILGSGVLFCALDTSAKYLVTDGMSAPFVAWCRFFGHALLAVLFLRIWRNPSRLKMNNVALQLLRGCFVFGSTLFNFLGLQTLQLAESQAIFFFAPMIITMVAGPILGEWAGWRRWMAIIVGFIGVLVATRPGFSGFGIGHAYLFLATLSLSGYVITTRYIANSETRESMVFYTAFVAAVFMLPIVPYTAEWPPSHMHWLILFGLGIFGGVGHWMLIVAYQKASTTALAPYPYFQMTWMVLSGYVFFSQLPDLWTIIGASIIVLSGLYIVYREHKLRIASRRSSLEGAGLKV